MPSNSLTAAARHSGFSTRNVFDGFGQYTHTRVLVAVGCPSSCVKSSGSPQLRRHRHTIFELHWENHPWIAHSCICLLKVQCLVHTSPWTGDIPGWYLLLRTVPFLLRQIVWTATGRNLRGLLPEVGMCIGCYGGPRHDSDD